jgi:hypothetical protein
LPELKRRKDSGSLLNKITGRRCAAEGRGGALKARPQQALKRLRSAAPPFAPFKAQINFS